jgi:hypothetical protein
MSHAVASQTLTDVPPDEIEKLSIIAHLYYSHLLK